jgi:hypothetical protein
VRVRDPLACVAPPPFAVFRDRVLAVRVAVLPGPTDMTPPNRGGGVVGGVDEVEAELCTAVVDEDGTAAPRGRLPALAVEGVQ